MGAAETPVSSPPLPKQAGFVMGQAETCVSACPPTCRVIAVPIPMFRLGPCRNPQLSSWPVTKAVGFVASSFPPPFPADFSDDIFSRHLDENPFQQTVCRSLIPAPLSRFFFLPYFPAIVSRPPFPRIFRTMSFPAILDENPFQQTVCRSLIPAPLSRGFFPPYFPAIVSRHRLFYISDSKVEMVVT